MSPAQNASTLALQSRSDKTRVAAARALPQAHRSQLGQFLTPSQVAAFMGQMLQIEQSHARLLDPGAGTGALTLGLMSRLVSSRARPEAVHAVCYEVEDSFLGILNENLDACREHSARHGLKFTYEIRHEDFLEAACGLLQGAVLGGAAAEEFDAVVMNPPYKKISSTSRERQLIRAIGFQTVNLYTGFLGAAAALLKDGGEIVAITPRSFCNGPYYRGFREFFLERVSLRHLHVFESRSLAFKDDGVLQETLITRARKTQERASVLITSSEAPGLPDTSRHLVDHDSVIRPDDHGLFIRLVPSGDRDNSSVRVKQFRCTLGQLSINVSTGKVVDFRSREFLLEKPGPDSAPLIYPAHFSDWIVTWPKENGKKPNAIRICEQTCGMLLPPECYVLTKRFSAKEEKRRLVAVVYEGADVSESPVAFENHVNVFHSNNCGLPLDLAWGLAAFLNSGMVEAHFRTFNGHTQVNASDLKSITYPTVEQLRELGEFSRACLPSPEAIDQYLLTMMEN